MTAHHPDSLLIRADADVAQGTGHVLRCLALAHAWRQSGRPARLLATALPEPLRRRVEADGVPVQLISAAAGSTDDAAATRALAARESASWLVVDGYQFDADYQRQVRSGTQRLLVLDDYGHAADYSADLVLNSNVTACPSLYRQRALHTRLLLGTRYAPLRREFWPYRAPRPERAVHVRRIVLTFGGADAANHTGRLLAALSDYDWSGMELLAVIGPGNPHRDQLADQVRRLPFACHLHHDVVDMAALLATADLVVTAAGSTTWELALLRRPAMLVITADNQHAAACALARRHEIPCWDARGCGDYAALAAAAYALTRDTPRRERLAQQLESLVDGWGAERVLAALDRTAHDRVA